MKELKYITAYLPYKVSIEPIWISTHGGGYNQKELTPFILNNYSLEDIIPILKPLSDLVKPEYNYITTMFVIYVGSKKYETFIESGYGLGDLPYTIVELLLENHFDIFGLNKRLDEK